MPSECRSTALQSWKLLRQSCWIRKVACGLSRIGSPGPPCAASISSWLPSLQLCFLTLVTSWVSTLRLCFLTLVTSLITTLLLHKKILDRVIAAPCPALAFVPAIAWLLAPFSCPCTCHVPHHCICPEPCPRACPEPCPCPCPCHSMASCP